MMFKRNSNTCRALKNSDRYTNIVLFGPILIIFVSFLFHLLCFGSIDLLVEEAYYWNYAQHLDYGYLDHPPMIAILIKLSTLLLGINELSVRLPSLACLFLTMLYSYKLSNLVCRGAGLNAVFLLSILPFFFLQSLLITPDQPLLVCWSAALYHLFRVLVLDEPKHWLWAGMWIGLGMLSKYTIVLVGLSTILYLGLVPSARVWFSRKEPYLCALVALLLFMPVIYWNFNHHWASFVFQGSRRFAVSYHFSLHQVIGLLVLFLMPLGILSLWDLLFNSRSKSILISKKAREFLQVFSVVPVAFFCFYSSMHEAKFNWIGPGLLAIIPWMASLMTLNQYKKYWLIHAIVLIVTYLVLFTCITFGRPEIISTRFFKKYISWKDLIQQLHIIAKQEEEKTQCTPIFVPLDPYEVASELNYYQAKFLQKGEINKVYPVLGRHIFAKNSLMYYYWSNVDETKGRKLILVSKKKYRLENPAIKINVTQRSPIQTIWSHSQGNKTEMTPYYYQIVEKK